MPFLNKSIKFISNNKSEILTILISMGLWLINFFIYKDYSYVFRVAKGFGLNLRVWTMFMYFTMCKSILNGKFDNHIDYHKFLGYVMSFCTLGHTVAHIIYGKGMNDLTHITGYILSFFILIMLTTYMLKKFNYSVFKIVHMIYFLFLPVCIIHMVEYWYFFGIPALVFSIEMLMNYHKLQINYLADILNTKIIENKHGNHVIYLTLPRKIHSVSGAYYYICFSELGLLEWHPYSISISSFTDQLVFLIEVKGDWTKGLYDILKKTQNVNEVNQLNENAKRLKNSRIMIMGPYYACSTDILKYNKKNTMAICTGIGITPFLSIIDTKIDSYNVNRKYRNDFFNVFGEEFEQYRKYNLKTIENVEKAITYKNSGLRIIWVFRDLNDVENLYKFIRTIMRDSSNITLEIFVTSKKYTEEKQIEFLNTNSEMNIEIKFGRPKIEEIFIKNQECGGVYYCGNPVMRKEIKKYCKEKMIDFRCENFE